MALTATELADEFATLHRATAAGAARARSCLGAVLQALLLFFLARQLRRVERLLRALPPVPAETTKRPYSVRTPRLCNRHGRPFIARQDRPEVLPTWWAFHPGARAHVIRAAPIPRPHTPRAPPHARNPT
jgi:hypothetical protein